MSRAWRLALALACIGAAPPEPARRRWSAPLPPAAGPQGAAAAERALADALRAAGLPPGAAAALGCADRALWVQLEGLDAAALDAAGPAVSRALARAVGARPPRHASLSLRDIEDLLSDLDSLATARGEAAPPAEAWVGGGAFAVQVDGLPLLRVRLLVAGADPAAAARLDGAGPGGLGAALRGAGVGAWDRGAALRSDGLLRVWADLLPAQAPQAIAAMERAVDAARSAPASAADHAEAALRAALEPPAPLQPRPASGARLLLIGDLDAVPVEIRARADWPSVRPSPAALSTLVGATAGIGCGGRAPLSSRRERAPAAR